MPSRHPRRRSQAAVQTSLFKQPCSDQLTILPTVSLSALTALLARLLQSYRCRRGGAGEGASRG
jgi:hypothetical protein